MERRTVAAALVAAGMSLAAGAFTVSAIADPAPVVQPAQGQPPPSTAAAAQAVVHQVATVDDVVVVTTVAVDAVRAIHPVATGTGRAGQPTLGGPP